MKRSKNNKTARGVVVLLFLVFVLTILPLKTDAVSVFSPFGGKVESYEPAPSSCVELITIPIAAATAGTIWVTVEKIKIKGAKDATVGILRVDGLTIPGLTTIYKNFMYFVPGTSVVGNSINICDVCERVEDIPVVGEICKIDAIKEFATAVCGIVSEDCPIGNIVHKIGTGSAKGELGDVLSMAKEVACSFVGSVPLIGDILGELCDSL